MNAATVEIRLAGEADADSIALLAIELFDELASPGASGYELDAVARVARDLLRDRNAVCAFVARAGSRPIGLLTLNECASLYAGGRFGEISELYVSPPFRAFGVGQRLLAAAVELARRRGWHRLEVGAPEQPKWERTVAFYRRAGFVEVGPRLKLEFGRDERATS